MLLLDSVSTFQWLERAEQARGGGSPAAAALSFDVARDSTLPVWPLG
jgi:hypothetical protein